MTIMYAVSNSDMTVCDVSASDMIVLCVVFQSQHKYAVWCLRESRDRVVCFRESTQVCSVVFERVT